MKLFLLLLIWVFYSVYCELADEEINKQWMAYKLQYGKNYGNATNSKFRGLSEDRFRKRIFSRKAIRIKKHNERYEQGLETYEMGFNDFTDFTSEEMKPYANGYVEPSLPLNDNDNDTIHVTSTKSIPHYHGRRKAFKSLNWIAAGFVTPVKHQGACGSCWAFAAAAAVESQVRWVKGYTHKIDVSEQQLVDCSMKNRNGCKGGWPQRAYDFMKKHGVASEKNYPYKGKYRKCNYKRPIVKVRKVISLSKKGDERLLAELVSNEGPVAACIHVSKKFFGYKSGVFYDPKCKRTPTHCVLIIGFGSHRGTDYWRVKNSWGRNWGERGYIRMRRNHNSHCGIADYCTCPLIVH